MDDNTKYIDIKFENLKELWEKYKYLREQKIQEIILARNGDYYFIES